jgi:hypothetical protein
MRKLSWLPYALTVPALAMLLTVSGCGGGDTGKGKTATTPAATGSPKPPAGADKTPVEGKGVAVLKGKATIEGEAPAPADFTDAITKQADNKHCLKEDPGNVNPTKGRDWVVSKDGGVANVAVWVRPPGGKYFKFTDEEKSSWPKEVAIDQPFCHFEPHVLMAFTKYYDGNQKKMVSTGQTILAKNSAPINHNTKWSGDPRTITEGNETLPGAKSITLQLDPHPTTPVKIACNIHGWMSAYIWVLDTPYAAVTREDGTYEIKGIPAGAEVELSIWHESAGWLAKGEKVTLNEGDNSRDIRVPGKK